MFIIFLSIVTLIVRHPWKTIFRGKLKDYCSQKHREALKERGIKNGIQDKAVKNRPLTQRQSQRNSLISKARYVVERTFGNQARWFGAKVLRYRGKAKAHAWHILQAMAYNLKRLPRLYVSRQVQSQS